MNENLYIEIECHQQNKHGKLVCGDVFLSKKIKAENRSVIVFSDGLGSGVKANILATMTASMAMNFTVINEPVVRTAKTIMNTLPVDAERQINYSTFSIINIDNDGEVHIVEYDNPTFLLIRQNRAIDLEPTVLTIQSNGAEKRMHEFHFQIQQEDRLVFYTDGITQSGIGSADMPFGWSENGVADFVTQLLLNKKDISARELSRRILQQAINLDGLKLKDDATCAVVYFRAPRRLLICSGPPFQKESDRILAEKVSHFQGQKVICGGTTAQILSRELQIPIDTGLFDLNSDLPPVSKMAGIDLVTEGILTIGKVVQIIEDNLDFENPKLGAAADILKLIIENDSIHFLIGTKVNNAHQDPNLPIELEIRRSVLKKMATLLETKFLKEVTIEYL